MTRILQENLILKILNFLAKLETVKVEKKIESALVFLVMKWEKISNLYIDKILLSRHVHFLLIEYKGTSHYVLIKDFNRFMYNQMLHRDRKHFVVVYSLLLETEIETLEKHTKDCYEINGKQIINMLKRGKLLNLKNMIRKKNRCL